MDLGLARAEAPRDSDVIGRISWQSGAVSVPDEPGLHNSQKGARGHGGFAEPRLGLAFRAPTRCFSLSSSATGPANVNRPPPLSLLCLPPFRLAGRVSRYSRSQASKTGWE